MKTKEWILIKINEIQTSELKPPTTEESYKLALINLLKWCLE